MVSVNQLKLTFVYTIWLDTRRKLQAVRGLTGITLLGDLYKNVAQLYSGFPYSLTTGASNVDLLPLQHLQCQGAPAKPTHTPQHITQRIQAVSSNIKLSYFRCITNITNTYNTARRLLLLCKYNVHF
jgi:hypothetical protein